jgi:hypothetical protein
MLKKIVLKIYEMVLARAAQSIDLKRNDHFYDSLL